ncbi:50S ribosomal protein L30e [Candidatus Micrarchaeota archaeon]|nr:50S ribosomal protein L30e [Candidatus Micrarchaeota archaeon]
MAEEENIEEEEAKTEETEERKVKKERKVVRRRKSTKEKENPVVSAIRLAVESGKVEFGSRSGIIAGIEGKAKLLIVAKNAIAETRTAVAETSKKSGVPIMEFGGTTMELGSVCGKPFPVSVLSVFSEGNSNLLELAKKK